MNFSNIAVYKVSSAWLEKYLELKGESSVCIFSFSATMINHALRMQDWACFQFCGYLLSLLLCNYKQRIIYYMDIKLSRFLATFYADCFVIGVFWNDTNQEISRLECDRS